MGNAPELPITAAALTDLDSVDSNRIHVVGPGLTAPTVTITSLGPGTLVEKRCRFDGNIIVHHDPAHLINLSKADRTMFAGDVVHYYADANGVWREEDYINQQFVQKFTTSQTNSVIMPVGYPRALFQLVGQGGVPGSFGAFVAGAASTGGYCEKLFTGCIGGGRFSITVDTSAQSFCGVASGNQPGGFVFPGSTFNAAGAPLQNYLIGGGAGQSSPASFGGDINEGPIAGTYVAGVRASTPGIIAHLNPITGAALTPAQQVLAASGPKFLTGLPDGGGAVAVDVTGATTANFKPGPPAVYITWMR